MYMYDGTTYFAWLVLLLIFATLVGMIVWLGSLPAKIAERRHHPQVDAINACSWWGLAFGGIGWMVAFVWAFTRTEANPAPVVVATEATETKARQKK